jgi:hypothetical protein
MISRERRSKQAVAKLRGKLSAEKQKMKLIFPSS